MIIKKVVTGELDGQPSIWLEGEDGEIKRLAKFDDAESYEDFLRVVEAGYLKPSKGIESLEKALKA